jgi:hypothetical protein
MAGADRHASERTSSAATFEQIGHVLHILMVRVRYGSALTVALTLGLAACIDDASRDLDVLDPAVAAETSPYFADNFDPASCDPLAFEQTLDVNEVNIERALDQHCFNSGAGRRALVIEALCARDMACAVSHETDCRTEVEARWQERQHPHGLSVPCADALLDSMSCLAQASCNDAHACDAASKRAQAKCDPNAPFPGAPMCPPLPADREPTKGPIPDDAINEAGQLDESRVPDFIPAWGHDDKIAGYVRYCAIHAGGAVPVYADDLKTVVGHMLPGRGFVPGALP